MLDHPNAKHTATSTKHPGALCLSDSVRLLLRTFFVWSILLTRLPALILQAESARKKKEAEAGNVLETKPLSKTATEFVPTAAVATEFIPGMSGIVLEGFHPLVLVIGSPQIHPPYAS
jgi:hypothetical protein